MKRVDPATWSSIAVLAMLLIAAAPVLLGFIPTRIPHLLWIALFVVTFGTLIASLWGDEPGRSQRLTFGVSVLASWALLLSVGVVGLVPVILVVVVASSPYLFPVRVGIMLTIANLAVMVVAFLPSRMDDGWLAEMIALVGFYTVIQAASLFSSVSLIREQEARRELAEAHVELQAATAELAETARTRERLRISRELHDLIGHQLTVLALELEAAKHRANGEAAEHIHRASDVARELLADVRSTVGTLRTEAGDLRETLQRIVGSIAEPQVTLTVDDDVDVDESRTTLLVRAVQEILTNTIRHAHAQRMRIDVHADGADVVLAARDDGRGARDIHLGNGLRGLKERFDEAGGSVVFDGSHGFHVTARMPA
ncbi:MAG: histidine kinase [Tessaracoccus sp.]